MDKGRQNSGPVECDLRFRRVIRKLERGAKGSDPLATALVGITASYASKAASYSFRNVNTCLNYSNTVCDVCKAEEPKSLIE